MKILNSRNFKQKHELIKFIYDGKTSEFTITEAKAIMNELQTHIMYAESNELISTFLRNNGMDEAQVETAVTQLNKLREKL